MHGAIRDIVRSTVVVESLDRGTITSGGVAQEESSTYRSLYFFRE